MKEIKFGTSGKSLSELAGDLMNTYGPRSSVRINLQLTDELISRLRVILSSPPREIGGFTAIDMVTLDGTKWICVGGDWVLLRISGTEPVESLYVETRNKDKLTDFKNVFSNWIIGREGSQINDEARK